MTAPKAPPAGWPVRVDPTFGCWLWTGPVDRDGYGRIGRELAHRAFWKATRGPIPTGMEIEHTCRRRACLRHLELLTRSQQERRKAWRNRVRIERCPEGHDLRLQAQVTPEGGRVCRACR